MNYKQKMQELKYEYNSIYEFKLDNSINGRYVNVYYCLEYLKYVG